MVTKPLDQVTYQPKFYDATNPEERRALVALCQSEAVEEVIEALESDFEDLFKIDFPFVTPGSPEYVKTLADYKQRFLGGAPWEEKGAWAYYPWRKAVVHLPESTHYYKLRTSRNKFLITPEEQDKFYAARIGVAGLSVGSSVVHTLALSGGAGHMRIADLDTLAMTNLNRLHGSVCDIGRAKGIMAARKIYELNPYQQLDLYLDGLQPNNMAEFFAKDGQKLDLYIEEMDNIKLKIESRFMARDLKIPVLMATDNGDNAIIDVERFDQEPDRPLFHGLIDENTLNNVPEQPNMSERIKLASKIVGADITPRTQYSLTMVGAKIPAWPQLGNAATLSGVAISYLARRIVVGDSVPSGRYEINLDDLLDPDYHSQEAKTVRLQKKTDFVESLKLLFGD